jgi:hypothetical protein
LFLNVSTFFQKGKTIIQPLACVRLKQNEKAESIEAPPCRSRDGLNGRSIHLASVGVYPGIVRAGNAEDPRVDGAAALLPHVELPAGPAQGLFAAVAVDDGRVLTAYPAGFCSIGQSHFLYPAFNGFFADPDKILSKDVAEIQHFPEGNSS